MGPSTGPPERPFVGLRPFKTHEGLIFFGRQRQIVELLERLHRARFVGVIGSSGSGKSSLIFAGLVPALQAGFLVGDRDRWVVVKLTPGDNPWRRLSDALSGALRRIGLEGDADLLHETAERAGVSGLVLVIGPLLEKANANLLLFVDQFEEIFRRDADSLASQQREEDTDFVSVVLGLSQQRDAPVFVVFTMRSDHLGDCDAFLGLPEALNESQYLVPRLSRDEVRLAIEGPIRLFQKEVAPRLVDRLLNDLGGQHDQLPVLQHALMRMWMRLAESGQPMMDLEHYKEVGTLTDALWRHADEALAGVDPAAVHAKKAVTAALDGMDREEVRFFQVVFQALTDTDHANRKVRRWQSLRGLRELTGRRLPDIHRLLERFVDDRRSFLRYSGEGGSTGPEAALVDISHESLIRQWDRLRSWVEEEAHNRDTYVRLRDDAKRWEAGAGGLWEDPELVQARVWWDKLGPTPVWARRYGAGFEAADRFLRESERKRDQEKQREQEEKRKEQERIELASRNVLMRRTVRRTTVAAFVALSLAAIAVWQWRRAETESLRAESGEHAAWALSLLRTDPEQSLRRAVQAVDKAPTTTSAAALSEALAVAVVRKLWSVPLARASAVAFSPDGRRLAAGSAAGVGPGRVGIWDVETARLQASQCNQSVAALRWTPDGSGVLLGLDDGSVVLWGDAAQGEPSGVTALVPARDVGRLEDMDVRPDGRELAVAAGEKGLLRFDLVLGATSASALARMKAPAIGGGRQDAIASVAYSPDGRRLAIGGSKGTVALVDSGTGQRLCETQPLGVEILRVAFSGPGLGLVAASSFDHALRSWPVGNCGSEPTRHVGHRAFVMDLGFTSDGAYLVSVSHDSTIKLWDPRAERDELFSRRMTRSVSGRTVAYNFSRVATAPPRASTSAGSSDRTRIATVGADREGGDSLAETLTLWDIATRDDANRLRALTGGAQAEDAGRLPALLSLARKLQVEPAIRDPLPGCR
jgi:conflict system STAND superfamily ATPase/WD40 domain-containing protein